jgi:YbbR domain-containing protein
MKWSNFYTILFFAAIFFTSCSDDADKKESSSTTESSNSTATNSSVAVQVAKQKRSDIAVQGLKGKVEVMSESFYPAEGSKKYSQEMFSNTTPMAIWWN